MVFGNVADVANASSSFLATLEKVDPNKGCYGNNVVTPSRIAKQFLCQLKGKCFLKHANELKEAYATYSCNHEAATVLLEKVTRTLEREKKTNLGNVFQYEADENIWNYFTACVASVE